MTAEPIQTAQILAAARSTTGLSELGDVAFLPGLEKFVESVNQEARLSPAGKASMVERLQRIVANRLRFTADLTAHPEILETALLPPVVIAGLPRVGSTKLQRMLAASGSFQDPLFWQVFNPARIPGASSGKDPRITEAERYVAWRNSTNPAANAAHHIAVHTVEEESFLLEFSFETMYPMAFASADSYYDWIQRRDRSYTYEYLAQLLQYLQWQFHREQPKPWILKSPPNLGFEAQILHSMPGARFIMSHRDPVTIVTSIAAVVKQSRKLYAEHVDAHAIGRWCLHEFSTAIRRHLKWRKANTGANVLDVAYEDIERKPMDVVRRSYDFLNVELTPAVAASIESWLEADRHGSAEIRHEYSLEACGLTAAQIEREFAEYTAAFGRYLQR
ncbi:MAG: sulfotransferase [Steroidobacteraceae bacterium]